MKKSLILLMIFVFTVLSLDAKSLRIEVEDLSKNISKYKILDVRDSKVYQESHLPNALNFNVNLTYNNKSIDGKITEPSKMQNLLIDLGLNIDDHIVVYDDGTIFDASRVFWALEVFGFKNVKLLNGGYAKWKNQSLSLTTEVPSVQKSDYIATINNKRLATKFTTQIATRNPNQLIIDARGYDHYVGKISSAKRYGHIPKALHIPAIHNLEKSKQVSVLKSKKELQKLYGGIEKDKKVVLYCAIGRIASTNYFALRELGYDVSNYDASWKEWGNDFNLPIRNRSQEK